MELNCFLCYGVIGYAAFFVLMKFLNVVYFSGGVCRSRARLEGRVAVVTGANTGIGKETAKDLAGRGARVVLACRSTARALPAVKEIVDSTGNAEVEFMELDLSSMESVRSFVDVFNAAFHRLDILVNNAGVMAMPFNKTVDGFEMQIGTNHLGHFLLTNLLLPRLKAAPEARVVTVSSVGHMLFGRKIDPDNLMMEKNYERWAQYGNSKMANVLFTKELARRLAGSKITTYAVHPGGVETELARNLEDTFFGKLVSNRWFLTLTPFLYFMKNPQQGAQTSIYCAVDEKCKDESGLYYADAAPASPAAVANDAALANKLWTVSEKLVGLA